VEEHAKQHLTLRAQKRALWLAKVKSVGCQSEAVHGVPCPMRSTALYYNLHHNEVALRCTSETNKLMTNGYPVEEFKKYSRSFSANAVTDWRIRI
jgi:hypothetical protein